MLSRWTFILCLAALSAALFAHAQTTDYHIRFGMKPSRSTPPEVIDMKWARKYMDDNATFSHNATMNDNATKEDK